MLADEAQDMARIATFLERTLGGPINADAEGAKALARAGWELKSGVLCAPASDGSVVPMWPMASVFGRVRDRAFQSRVLHTMQPEYKAVVSRYLASWARSQGSTGVALTQLDASEQKALTEGTDNAGGFL